MSRIARGFTLIELMIIVAIVSILVAVALPQYQAYAARAKVAELILAAAACRTTISEVYQSGGSAPAPGGWGCETTSAPSKYVTSMTTDANGMILVQAATGIHPSIDTKLLTMAPLIGNAPADAVIMLGQSITAWRCGSIPDGTTIPSKFLPASCRG